MNKTEKSDQYRQTSEMLERFCFVISVTVINRHNTEKDDGDNDDDINTAN
jgi:hypothetical protein